MTDQPSIPARARKSHATLADHRRVEAQALLTRFEENRVRTPDEGVQAMLVVAAAVLSLEARLADLVDTLAIAAGLNTDPGEVAG